ncbi:MAG: hypothetical protein WC349_04160 [Patescibacteria group bacterium]|jgi:hypothetical protein
MLKPNDPKNNEQKLKSFSLNSNLSINKKTKKVLIVFLIFIAVIVIGNYHIVLNATDPLRALIFVKRPYFGFSDIFGDINACSGAPYFSVMSNHPSLCRALQNAGYLESEEARSQRIETEIMQKLQLY